MRVSQYPLFTIKKNEFSSNNVSHQLMLRSGMIRKLSSGLYSWLPTGIRILRKLENILREEMNNIGAMEILMPIIQPEILWMNSGRLLQYGSELFRLNNRSLKKFILTPTNEEVITKLVKHEMFSYKIFPLHFYQIQTKFRDELRPKCGLIRSREFIMKDSYSFHTTQKSLENTYCDIYKMYERFFDKIELKFFVKQVDSGIMGGEISHEFQAIIKKNDNCTFDKNVLFCNIINELNPLFLKLNFLKKNKRNIYIENNFRLFYNSEVDLDFYCSLNKIVKIFIVHSMEIKDINLPFTVLMLQGDHILDYKKVESLFNVKIPLVFANDKEVNFIFKNHNKKNLFDLINSSISIIIDNSIYDIMINLLFKYNVFMNFSERLNSEFSFVKKADLKKSTYVNTIKNNENVFDVTHGIEVAHIFQLGLKYSKIMKLNFLSINGKVDFVRMGCYGIGITRLLSVIVEQNHDKYGILWPKVLSPFDVVIIAININSYFKVKRISEIIYCDLQKIGIDVLFYDIDERPGVMFYDVDLIGIPHIIIVSNRSLQNDNVEYRNRKTRKSDIINFSCIVNFLSEKL
ncbi:MAG: proline--tRNA ligase [Candidatus Westeberhardia cardiocondylae]|nr:proline--tRNA ligase [Candidatus Westeberhardia cardiocondylae]